jgi:hypothetical protein
LALDERTPFFVSYRRADARNGDGAAAPDEVVQQFHHKLSDDVGQLIALPRGHDIGFLDTDRMPGGTIWHPELLRALGSCQVLVALMSVPYLKSEWCGKEWNAFASRRRILQRSAEPNKSNIVPIRWAPIPDNIKIPAAVTGHTNIFSPKKTGRNPDLSGQYNANGLYHLLEAGENDSAHEIIWQIAMLIQTIYYNQRLDTQKFTPEDLKDDFGDGSHA